MTLYDIIPTTQIDAAPSKALLEKAEAAAETLRSWKQIKSKYTIYDDTDYNGGRKREGELADLSRKIRASSEETRGAVFMETASLPKQLVYDDTFSKFASSPTVTLESVRNLADAFGFVAIPKAYGDFQQADRFDNSFGGALTCYVICPLGMYLLEKHVSAENDLPIYAGAYSQAFMALQMSIPLFRQMARNMDAISDRQDRQESRQNRVEVRLSKVEGELTNLKHRMENLERMEVERQRKEFQIAKAAKVMAEDPIAIAVPTSTGILGDGWAKVGPCWGPEFEPKLAKIRGYETANNPKAIAW